MDTIQPRRKIMQNSLLIWLDPNIDESKKNYQNTLTQLRNIVNDINLFINVDECIDFLTEIKNEKAFMIVSMTLGQQLLPHIHEIPQLHTIYIYCIDQVQHEQWIKQWSKVKGIYAQTTPLYQSLQATVKQYDEDSISISLITVDENLSNRKLDQLEPSFMYTQIFKEIMLEMKYDQLSINDFITYCRSGDYGSTKNIDQFEIEYHPHLAIWWYTYPSILFSMLNRALRTLESDTMMKMGFFIQDLHRQIETLHQQQFGGSSDEEFIVYRGQGLLLEDFEKLKKTKGGLISFNNFLSTSKKRDVSLEFAQGILSNIETIGILFRVTVNPSISSTPFALIDKLSYFQTEEEVLFSMHTVFRIGDVEKINSNNRLYQIELKLTADNDQQLREITEHIRNETFPDAEGWYRMGKLLVKLAHYDKAEQVYSAVLQQVTSDVDKANVYYQLGVLKHDQGDYETAIYFYKKAHTINGNFLPVNQLTLATIKNNIALAYNSIGEYSKALSHYEKVVYICERTLPPGHPDLATAYNNIGLVYANMGDYSKAFLYYKKALELEERALLSNHPSLAISYNNIGEVYRNMREYSKALSYYKKALDIEERTLPPGHPWFATSYNNIGLVYDNMKNYSKALSYHKKTLDIEERILPPGHPSFATSYDNIGSVYDNIEQHSEALIYYEKALKIRQMTLTPDHPDLAIHYQNIGDRYHTSDNYSKALSYYEKALEIKRKTLHAEHPELATLVNSIGAMYQHMEEHSTALSYYERALEIWQKTLPQNLPHVAICYNNIALVHRNLGNYSKALSILERALDTQQHVLPLNHRNLEKLREDIETIKEEIVKNL